MDVYVAMILKLFRKKIARLIKFWDKEKQDNSSIYASDYLESKMFPKFQLFFK